MLWCVARYLWRCVRCIHFSSVTGAGLPATLNELLSSVTCAAISCI